MVAGGIEIKRAANWARIIQIPLLPVSRYGGAAAENYFEERKCFDEKYAGRLEKAEFEELSRHTGNAELARSVVSLAARIQPTNIFFGYCTKAQSTADSIIKYLTKTLKLEVTDWAVDFGTGAIFEKVSSGIKNSRYGLFLFSRDDELSGDAEHAAPRDNVVFEAGYCMAVKGPRKTIIIREEGAKMPADLGGSIYIGLGNHADISPIHEKLRQALVNPH